MSDRAPVEQPTDEHDPLTERLARYAAELRYEELPLDVRDVAQARIIDTFGALIEGFEGDATRIARTFAARYASPAESTILCAGIKVPADLAAFANAVAARYSELNDVYHWPGSGGGHPSDMIMALLAVAEMVDATGQDFILATVIAYEIYLRLADASPLAGFDYTNYAGIAAAAACARLMTLSHEQIVHGISIAATAHCSLGQTRIGRLSMWKAAASGQMAKDAVLSALLARSGMEGPPLAMSGERGWVKNLARAEMSLPTMGGEDPNAGYKICDTIVKPRASCASTISSILAAERAATQLNGTENVAEILVEVYRHAKVFVGEGTHHWSPVNRESADHSIPYVVAVCLADGTVTPAQFEPDRLFDPEVRRLMASVKVIDNEAFTKAYEKTPVEHHTRVTVRLTDGEEVVGENKYMKGGPADPMTMGEIEEKFRQIADLRIGQSSAARFLDQARQLQGTSSVSGLIAALSAVA